MRAPLPISVGLLLVTAFVPAMLDGQTTWLRHGPSLPIGATDDARPTWAWLSSPVPHRPLPQTSSPGIARVTAFSALVPGLGQHALGQSRKWAYWAVEAVGWVFYVERRRAGGDLRNQYRTFAWNEARIQSAARIDGDFTYYETLTKWNRSGAFDGDPAATGIQPEIDPTAFNGSIWALATQIFLPGGTGVPTSDPQYQRALEYYLDRAYGANFLWDWTGTGTAQDEYGGLITRSDDRFRQATNVLGAIIANHVVSAVDGYLSARGVATPSELRFASSIGPRGAGWSTWVQIPLTR